MPSFLLFGITILPAFRRISPLLAMLRSLQIFLNGAVVLFLDGLFVFCICVFRLAYSSSLFFVSDSTVVVAAKQGIAGLVVSSSSMAWNVGTL